MSSEDARTARIETLQRRLRHSDPVQLWFQISEIAGDETYTRHGVSVQPGDVVIDAGANVGVAAAYFALIRQAAVIHCFEPVAPLFELLSGNLADVPGCVLHPEGLSYEEREAQITYYAGAGAMSGLYADPERDRADTRAVMLGLGLSPEVADQQLAGRYEPRILPCRLRTLSSFLRESRLERVDLLKIDVERAELDVLRGIADEDWPKVRQVAIEVHDEDGRAEVIRRMLTAHGFAVTLAREELMGDLPILMVYATRDPRERPRISLSGQAAI